jgi:ribulose-phosphate 3-epimerase
MTVEPGFGAQKFIPAVLPKIKEARLEINKRNPACILEVDGGINTETGVMVVHAGAEALVAGNSIFGANDPQKALRDLRKYANVKYN